MPNMDANNWESVEKQQHRIEKVMWIVVLVQN